MTLFITLYIVGFIRTLVVIAIIYLGIRLISRYVLPLLINKGMKNMQQKMQDQQRQQSPRRPEGEVTVEKPRSNSKNNNHNNGEYVDFEEVD